MHANQDDSTEKMYWPKHHLLGDPVKKYEINPNVWNLVQWEKNVLLIACLPIQGLVIYLYDVVLSVCRDIL